MINAWIIVTSLLTHQAILQKQIRVEQAGCHLPSVKGEYPIDGEWHRVTIKVVCKR